MKTTVNHLALIMDGNGRWAESQGLSRSDGHRKGVEVVQEIVQHAYQLEIPHLTLFAFSSLNWGRPSTEVKALMELLYQFLETQAQSLIEQGIRVEAIGERELLPRLVRDLLQDLEKRSADGRTMLLTLALSYDGRRDLLKATKALVELARKGELLPADVHEELLMSHLSTGKYQEVDLLIRTSGERRLSGFLPLEACYAELIFLDKMWPDFTSDDLDEALMEYGLRQRRFGLTEAQSYITPELFFSPT